MQMIHETLFNWTHSRIFICTVRVIGNLFHHIHVSMLETCLYTIRQIFNVWAIILYMYSVLSVLPALSVIATVE